MSLFLQLSEHFSLSVYDSKAPKKVARAQAMLSRPVCREILDSAMANALPKITSVDVVGWGLEYGYSDVVTRRMLLHWGPEEMLLTSLGHEVDLQELEQTGHLPPEMGLLALGKPNLTHLRAWFSAHIAKFS